MCQYGEQLLKQVQERHEWLMDENKRLKGAITKSEMTMKKENINYKANMDMKVAQGRVQLVIEKENYRWTKKHYQIALSVSLGFFIFIALYVIRIYI